MDQYEKTMEIPVGESMESLEKDPVQEKSTVVVGNGKIKAYVTAAQKCLDQNRLVYLKGVGKSVTKAVSCSEILKHRIIGLHQVSTIGMTQIHDVWEPKEGVKEDVDIIRVERKVPKISVMLSLDSLDPATPGYQPPIPESEVTKGPDM